MDDRRNTNHQDKVSCAVSMKQEVVADDSDQLACHGLVLLVERHKDPGRRMLTSE
jgi:hypothetical protein